MKLLHCRPVRCSNGFITNITDCNPTISFRHTTDFSRIESDELQVCEPTHVVYSVCDSVLDCTVLVFQNGSECVVVCIRFGDTV